MANQKIGKVYVFFLVLAMLTAGGFSARAQTEEPPVGTARADIAAFSADSFPTIMASLDLYAASGNFISGLTPAAVTVLEDNQPRPLDSLEELQPGVQFVIALDPGPAFATRFITPTGQAVTRYNLVAQALLDWAAAQPDDRTDDLSLVATDGTGVSHLTAAESLLDSLSAYQPNLSNMAPSLQTLSHALDIAAETPPRPDMKRAVLFVTSPLDDDALPALQSLAARAVELKVRVYVWIVASTDYFAVPGATALIEMANQTGGQPFTFSGEETLPDLEIYLTPLRHIYHLAYSSSLTTSGSHTMAVRMDANGQTLTSVPLTFDVDVQSPNPMLVSPPEQIVRQAPDEGPTSLAALVPAQQSIDILVEFPDGHPRPLIRTILYVDGQPVGENTSKPFDQFTWDLSSYTSSGQHTLQVEALDSLGLSKISLGVPVTVTIIQPPHGLIHFLTHNSLWVALGAVLLAGAVLAIILTGWRIRRSVGKAGHRSDKDPVTQPVLRAIEKRSLHLPWTRRSPSAVAYLVRLKADGEPVTAPPVPLTGTEMTFGSDPIRATRVLDDPSISPLHARLKQTAEGDYTLNDERSVAGTWVNYEPLTQEPRRLQHGDLIHFGQLSYRYKLSKPPEKPAPRVTTLQKP